MPTSQHRLLKRLSNVKVWYLSSLLKMGYLIPYFLVGLSLSHLVLVDHGVGWVPGFYIRLFSCLSEVPPVVDMSVGHFGRFRNIH